MVPVYSMMALNGRCVAISPFLCRVLLWFSPLLCLTVLRLHQLGRSCYTVLQARTVGMTTLGRVSVGPGEMVCSEFLFITLTCHEVPCLGK